MNSELFPKVRAPRHPQATRPRVVARTARRQPIAINVFIMLFIAAVLVSIVSAYFDALAVHICTLPENTTTIARCLQAMFRP